MCFTLRRVGWAIGIVLAGMAGTRSAAPESTKEAVAPPTRASVAAPAELLAARARLLDRLRRGEAPSFAVGVVRGREVVWEEGLGWADREAGLPATADTRYSVASVSKSITATGALVLAAEGRLKLEQSVDSILGAGWMPASAGSTEGMLVSHLLAHTSGIPHLWHYEYPDRPESLLGREALIRNHAFVAARPGERFLYSNLGYGVLAQVVEKAGEAPFQRVMERSLFGPLGMKRTTTEAWVGDAGTAQGYSGEGQAIPYRYRLGPDGGAGFLASAHDLLRYVLFHLGALAPAGPLRAGAVSSWLGSLPSAGHYYRGWGVVQLPAAHLLISDGETAGGTAVMLLVPQKELGLVVLCNATGGPATESAVAILTALLPGFDESFAAAVSVIERELAAPGQLPAGRFEGSLRSGSDDLPMKLDFRHPEAPVLELGPFKALLQGIAWERGALQATVQGSLPLGVDRGRTHRLLLTLWPQDGGLQGIAQEDLLEDRPRYGVPHRVMLTPVL